MSYRISGTVLGYALGVWFVGVFTVALGPINPIALLIGGPMIVLIDVFWNRVQDRE